MILYASSFYLHFNGHFPGEPGLASVHWRKGWWKWWRQTGAIAQSSSQIITTIKPTPSFLQAGCPSCRPTNSVKALKGKYHTPWTCLPQTHLGSSNFVFDHYSSWLPWGRFAMPLISPLMPVPQFIPISYSHIGYVSSLCSINNKIPVTLPAAKC